MQKRALAIVLYLLLSGSAFAEMQFPDWDDICPQDQRKTGFVVSRSGSNVSIRVPPDRVALFRRARLYLKHKEWTDGFVEVNMGFMPRDDGWTEVNASLEDKAFDHGELVIYIEYGAEALRILPRRKSCEDMDYVADFGGFTFIIPRPR